MAQLLPREALQGRTLGLSLSESPDLTRLGFLDVHLRLAVAEIARVVLVSGGKLAYGGHLKPEGYTTFLVSELARYSRRDCPLQIVLAWQEHRELSLGTLKALKEQLGLSGEVICLDPEGREVDPEDGRREDPAPVPEAEIRRKALTALRQELTKRTEARVLIGGKRQGFQGVIPGLMEEALLALNAGQPLFLAGGFGGVTLDIAVALGVDDGSWLPKRNDAPPPDPRHGDGLARLEAWAARPGWAGLHNGLSDDENRRLAASHRPSDIAALVGLGLGRLHRFVA